MTDKPWKVRFGELRQREEECFPNELTAREFIANNALKQPVIWRFDATERDWKLLRES